MPWLRYYYYLWYWCLVAFFSEHDCLSEGDLDQIINDDSEMIQMLFWSSFKKICHDLTKINKFPSHCIIRSSRSSWFADNWQFSAAWNVLCPLFLAWDDCRPFRSYHRRQYPPSHTDWASKHLVLGRDFGEASFFACWAWRRIWSHRNSTLQQ